VTPDAGAIIRTAIEPYAKPSKGASPAWHIVPT